MSNRDSGRPAMVYDDGAQIEVTVHYEHGDHLERRFVGRSISWGDDPHYQQHDYTLPSQMWFSDPEGIICLIDPIGKSNSFGRQSTAKIRFSYAVRVGRVGVSYDRVNSIESRVEGLEEWVGVGCINHRYGTSTPETVFTLRRPAPISISRTMNAALRPTYTFRASTTPGQTSINDEIRIRTSVKRPREWRHHLDVHEAVRDLVAISGWRNYGLWGLKVSRFDDPERALSGDIVSARWSDVLTHTVTAPVGDSRSTPFLFLFDDIGATGVHRWITLRSRHLRAIGGMLASVGLSSQNVETAIAEAGAALEHLGYEIAAARNMKPAFPLHARLSYITSEITIDLGIDLRTWPTRFADAYNTVKHPDRERQTDFLAQVIVVREAQMIFRTWIAIRLGVPTERLRTTVQQVPLSRPYEVW